MDKEGAGIFLSYCREDDKIADDIYDHLNQFTGLRIHRDKISIGIWRSIKEFMQSISEMDFTILLISDSYLRSANCMFEVLELMRDRYYKKRIFPAVINSKIYDVYKRAEYVKYWQEQYEELRKSLQGIALQNIGELAEDLKRRQEIASNIAVFLDTVSDLNNPDIKDIAISIENKLRERGLIHGTGIGSGNVASKERDLFDILDIPRISDNLKVRPTDFEIKQFMRESFEEINKLLFHINQQTQRENPYIQITDEKVDARTYIYEFYKHGTIVTALKIYLDNCVGRVENHIEITAGRFAVSGNGTYNNVISCQFENGRLTLEAAFIPFTNSSTMTVVEVVREIWKAYINPSISSGG